MIKLENICSGYGQEIKVENVTVSFQANQITTIIGPNGCGKTTLLKTACRLLRPFSGTVTLDGQNFTDIPPKEFARQVSVLPQGRNVPNITIENLVTHGRFPYLGFARKIKKEDKEIVLNALEMVGMADKRNNNVMELSGGERQKVYIAMLIAQNTEILFLDEPTTYLDLNHQFEVLEMMKKLRSQGKTIIMVLHDIGQALTYSQRICLMDHGKILMDDEANKVGESGLIDQVFQVHSQVMEIAGKKVYYFMPSASISK